MQIIVIGCGKVGAKLARVMADEGHEVVIVDNDSKAFKNLGVGFNGLTVTGVPIDQDVLKQAGIETADALAAVTPDDNVNIMACQVAREIFKIPRVIARIYNPAREHVFHEFGLDTICPTNLTVDVIRSMIMGSEEYCDHTIGNERITFRHEKVPKGFEGKKLDSVAVSEHTMLFGIIQNGKMTFANPNIRMNRDDILVFAEKIE